MTDEIPYTEPRWVSDARTLRALTHPTRIALIEALTIHGPMTATAAAERIGESPSSCSFHLRQLAKYGFVEEAGRGSGRRRPWKVTRLGFSTSTIHDDPAADVAAATLIGLLRGRQLGRFRVWQETQASYPRAWRSAAVDSEYVFWMTTQELEALRGRLNEILVPLLRERFGDASLRPEGALPVELLVLGYPMEPPTAARGD